MEHRLSERIAADYKALIYKLGLPVIVGRTRDISKNGVYVQCPIDGLSLHQVLEVELHTSDSASSRASRFTCYLARADEGGLALAIKEECQQRYASRAEALISKSAAQRFVSEINTVQSQR